MASFGTMCKPLHAGMAAEAGLRAAEWAARGFTGATDIIEHERGFAATHGIAFDTDAALADRGATYLQRPFSSNIMPPAKERTAPSSAHD